MVGREEGRGSVGPSVLAVAAAPTRIRIRIRTRTRIL